jgi:4-carboxymuconolactone decarboxylase
MSRIPYPEPGSLPAANRELLATLPQLNIHRMLAGSPSMFQPMVRIFNAYLNDGVLDKELREIAILRVGHLLNSDYEIISHCRTARLIGMSEERINAVAPGKDQAVFSALEQLAIKFVDEVVQEGAASEVTFAAVAEHMSPAEMIELTVVIGVYTLVSQLCATFDIEIEETPISDSGIDHLGAAVERLA